LSRNGSFVMPASATIWAEPSKPLEFSIAQEERKMSRLQLFVAVIVASFVLLMGPGDQPVLARALQPTASCTAATLQGSYDFVAPATITIAPGTVIAIPEELLYASPAPYASKGTLTFDGNGKVLLNATDSFQGQLASPLSYAGDYTMNDGCAATATFSGGIQLGVKMVGSGGVQTLVSTTPGFVIMRPH
jgi:hypothetical protein